VWTVFTQTLAEKKTRVGNAHPIFFRKGVCPPVPPSADAHGYNLNEKFEGLLRFSTGIVSRVIGGGVHPPFIHDFCNSQQWFSRSNSHSKVYEVLTKFLPPKMH